MDYTSKYKINIHQHTDINKRLNNKWMEKRQISHAKIFQIIYVDIPSLRRWNITLSVWAVHKVILF